MLLFFVFFVKRVAQFFEFKPLPVATLAKIPE